MCIIILVAGAACPVWTDFEVVYDRVVAGKAATVPDLEEEEL